jgi:hypothetical protein
MPMAHESDQGDQGASNNGAGENEPGNTREDERENENAQGNENEDQHTQAACGPSALTVGALVRAAELQITPAGTFFEEIELVS